MALVQPHGQVMPNDGLGRAGRASIRPSAVSDIDGLIGDVPVI